MSMGRKMTAGDVWPVAKTLIGQLADSCERIEISGSLRRAAGEANQEVGDIEIVAMPKPTRLQFGVPADRQRHALEARLLGMIQDGDIRRNPPDLARYAWGEKYKKFWIPVGGQWFQVDLFLADQRNWGAIHTIRTGPHEFSRALVTHIRYKTPYMQEDGYLRMQANGEIVPVPDERDYFALAGVMWVEPSRRVGANSIYWVKDFRPTRGDDGPPSKPDQLSLF